MRKRVQTGAIQFEDFCFPVLGLVSTPLTEPHLLEDVLPALHDAHEDVEGGEDGRADEELVQHHLLRDRGGRLAHEPGPMGARRAVT